MQISGDLKHCPQHTEAWNACHIDSQYRVIINRAFFGGKIGLWMMKRASVWQRLRRSYPHSNHGLNAGIIASKIKLLFSRHSKIIWMWLHVYSFMRNCIILNVDLLTVLGMTWFESMRRLLLIRSKQVSMMLGKGQPCLLVLCPQLSAFINWEIWFIKHINRQCIVIFGQPGINTWKHQWNFLKFEQWIILMIPCAGACPWVIVLFVQHIDSSIHWGRDKIADISQTFSNAFSWMKIYEFRLKFHWSLFPNVQLIILMIYWRKIYASLDLSELMQNRHHSTANTLGSWWRHQMETFSPLLAICAGLRWIPHTKASDAEFWCFLWSAPT